MTLIEVWQKYSKEIIFGVVGILIILSVINLLRPAKEIHTEKTTIDSTWKQQFAMTQSQMIASFKQSAAEVVSTYKKNLDINKDVNTITEHKYDATTGKMTYEKITKIDKTTYDSIVASTTSSTVTVNAGVTSTSTVTVTSSGSGTNHSVDTQTTIKENVGLLSIEGTYLHLPTTSGIALLPGINLDAGTTISAGPALDLTKGGLGYAVGFRTSIK